MSSANLQDVVERHYKNKGGTYPDYALAVVAARCHISIEKSGWKAKAKRKLDQAIDQYLGVTPA